MTLTIRIPCKGCYRLVKTYYDLQMFWTAAWWAGCQRPLCAECKKGGRTK